VFTLPTMIFLNSLIIYLVYATEEANGNCALGCLTPDTTKNPNAIKHGQINIENRWIVEN